MKYKKVMFCVTVLICLGLSGLHAQVVLSASGGNATTAGGSVSYSVGQVVYSTYTNTSGSVAQGVQQAYEIVVVSKMPESAGIALINPTSSIAKNQVITGIDNANAKPVVISAYPNPVKENVKLKVENFSLENLSFRLFDANGKLLENQKVVSNETLIVMSQLPIATYFLKVVQTKNTSNPKEIIVFKIIKN